MSIGRGGCQSDSVFRFFIHQWVVGQDNSEGIHIAFLRYNEKTVLFLSFFDYTGAPDPKNTSPIGCLESICISRPISEL